MTTEEPARELNRAKQWRSLPAPPQHHWVSVWVIQAGTALALFWTLDFLFVQVLTRTNALLVVLPITRPIQSFYRDPAPLLLTALTLLLIASPWLIDALLLWFYGLESLTLGTLTQSSPEAGRLLPRIFQQHQLPLPTLRLLPHNLPVAMSYGFLPRFSRIVVSRGLLQQLSEDEIAAICARESHRILSTRPAGLPLAGFLFLLGVGLNSFGRGNWGQGCWWLALVCLLTNMHLSLLSLLVLVAQVPYTLYRQLAQGAEAIQVPGLSSVLAAFSALSYGFFRLPQGLGLVLSRSQVTASDRFTVEATGNPNGLSRALVKLVVGIAQEIRRRGSTPYLLEGLALLFPVDPQHAVLLGSAYPHPSFSGLLQWECCSPYRSWLLLANSASLLGERLSQLNAIAHQWGLKTELDLPVEAMAPPLDRLRLLRQFAPQVGLLLGLLLSVLLWIIGWIGEQQRLPFLAWMAESGDRQSLLLGFALIGFSLGSLFRINALFPEIQSATLAGEPELTALCAHPAALPLDSSPVSLSGRLLGRSGIANGLGQDLRLETPTGLLIKLRYTPALGPLGNLMSQSPRPWNWVRQSVSLRGWLRGGAAPWIDIDVLRTQTGRSCRSAPAVWFAVVAIAAAIAGVWSLGQGNPFL